MEVPPPKANTAADRPFRMANFSGTLSAEERDPETERCAPFGRDKIFGQHVVLSTLKEMLDDPMVRLIMRADGVSECDLRRAYTGSNNIAPEENFSISAAENEGMPPMAS